MRARQCPHRLGQALAADSQSHPRLQSGARRVDDARGSAAAGVRGQALARARPQGHRRQDGRDRRGFGRRLHRRLRRRPHQGFAPEDPRRPQGRGRGIRRQRQAQPRNEARMTPTQATAAKAPITASQHANPRSDIEISQAAKKRLIVDIAREKLSIGPEHLEPYGHYKAKISMDFIKSLKNRPNGSLLLFPPTPPPPGGRENTPPTGAPTDPLTNSEKKAILPRRDLPPG